MFQKASIVGLLRTVVIIVGTYYIFKFVFRLLLPYLIQWLNNQMQNNVQSNFGNNVKEDIRRDGDISIKNNGKQKKSTQIDDVGEYVEFEEIND